MKRIRRRSHGAVIGCLFTLALAFAPAAAQAGDGVIEINQAKAVAGGVTPGDAPGFPVTLTSGSYRLTSELVGTQGEDGIEISGDVTLDLNGFRLYRTILGFAGHGIKVTAATTAARIMNGTIEGFYGSGVYVEVLASDEYPVRLEHLNILNHGFYGVYVTSALPPVGSNVIVEHSIVTSNNSDGILNADVVRDSQALRNGGLGIWAAVVSNCVVESNGGGGINGQTITGNRVRNNTSASTDVEIEGSDVIENFVSVGSLGIAIKGGRRIWGNSINSASGTGIDLGACSSADVRQNKISGSGKGIRFGDPNTFCLGGGILIESNALSGLFFGIEANASQQAVLYLNNRFGEVTTLINILSGGAGVTDGGGNIAF